MPSIKEIRASNAPLSTSLPASLISVFIGATAGIGQSTLHQLALHSKSPKVYIIGRSASAASKQLASLQSINPSGTFTFLEAQISSLKEVDRVVSEIKQKEEKIDLLWLSSGSLSLNGRQDTVDGLALNLALTYYSRMRFIQQLLPLLHKSTFSAPRVVAVLAAGDEGNFVTDDLELKTHYTLPNTMVQGATMNTLALEHLAANTPATVTGARIAFLHVYPGLVNSDLLSKLLGNTSQAGLVLRVLGTVLSWTVLPVFKLFQYSLDEAGENGLFVLTSERFAGAFFRVRITDPAAENKVLDGLRGEGWSQKVWEATEGVFERSL